MDIRYFTFIKKRKKNNNFFASNRWKHSIKTSCLQWCILISKWNWFLKQNIFFSYSTFHTNLKNIFLINHNTSIKYCLNYLFFLSPHLHILPAHCILHYDNNIKYQRLLYSACEIMVKSFWCITYIRTRYIIWIGWQKIKYWRKKKLSSGAILFAIIVYKTLTLTLLWVMYVWPKL